MESKNESCVRAFSSPDLVNGMNTRQHHVDPTFVGVSTNVRLLMKLIHEHKEAIVKGENGRRDERLSEMLVIIDEVKSKITKSQSAVVVKRSREQQQQQQQPELRRCNTDLRRNVPRDAKKSSNEPITDEKERLRKELNASMTARKTLESICSSIGKEKMIIAKELARKVQQLEGMEQHVNDLKAQNEMLVCKVQACVADHRSLAVVKKNNNINNNNNNIIIAQAKIEDLQNQNKTLRENLLVALHGYRYLKRKLKEYQERRIGANARIEEMGHRVRAGLYRIHSFKDMMVAQNDDDNNNNNNKQQIDIEHEISALEHMFKCFDSEITKHAKIKKHDRVINPDKLRCPAA